MTVDGRLYWQKFKDHSDIQEWKVDMTELSHINYFTLELKKKKMIPEKALSYLN